MGTESFIILDKLNTLKNQLNKDRLAKQNGMVHFFNYISTWNNYYASPFDMKFTTADLEQMQSQESIKLPVEASI